MKACEAPAYNAAVQARLRVILAPYGTEGAPMSAISRDMGLSHTVCGRHMAALIEDCIAVAFGVGNQRRYRLRLAHLPRLIAAVPEDAKQIVVDGRRHVLARSVVRSVFELGAAHG